MFLISADCILLMSPASALQDSLPRGRVNGIAFCGFFQEDFSIACNSTVADEFEMIWKEVVVAVSDILSRYLPGAT
jgi:hypothetical protein